MFSTKAELPQKSALQIKQDDKFFSRLLSKENSISYPSFRVAVAVPFVWESQPGTPKYTFCEDTLPPLTPPPSYYSNTFNKKPLNKNKGSRSNNLFMALFPKLNLKKTIISSPSSFSSSWSSSDNSSKVVSLGKNGRRRFLSYGSSIDFRGDADDDEDGVASPTSTLCFGITLSSSLKR
ncbi:hypothetical protein TanjilG_12904 [Lupinus angustifolius]|uniref:Uncharacterized protein n=2 Tax=Lupinus angustifolius TaxID=3871 RepID=A0A1J7GLQ8_LUPAN|nr:PREDICTED: uncharacterized protein LOC109359419 isoform X2 [Lupinus angustifolius]OIW01364.1 hypothetical protein TanjilG_12904 [Lupinus angustifolius]